MGYTKYAWVGNRIPDEDKEELYRMKLRTRRPITALITEHEFEIRVVPENPQ